MGNRYRIYCTVFWVLISMSLIACGNGDMNFNVERGNFVPPVNTDFEAREPFSYLVQVGNSSRLRLEGINGEVYIAGSSGSTAVMVTGIKRVRSFSAEDAEEHLPHLTVNVQSLPGEVFVETVQPHDTWGRSYVVDYTITVPKDLEIQLANDNGVVTLDSIDNDVTVNNENGDVTLMQIGGSASVNVVNGMIDGKITVPLDGSISLNTVNGTIALAIPTDTSAEFSAAVTIGSISSSNLVFQNEVRTPGSLSGRLGNGQGTISLEAEQTGSVQVSGF
jgi:DUF4097 and DUF4098 domain-containing protein YvlB